MDNLQATELTHAMWMGKSSRLAIIYKNNIYWTDNLATQDWEALTQWQPSATHRFIINGLPDWTYSGIPTRTTPKRTLWSEKLVTEVTEESFFK